jgi:UDP-4-keto-D-QuiNAc 4-reductase
LVFPKRSEAAISGLKTVVWSVMEKILVTGPDGFVGYRLCERLLREGFQVCGAQFAPAPLPEGCESVVVGDLAEATNWDEALDGVDRLVHLAARVHIMDDDAADPLEAFRHVNVEGTRKLAEAAARAGVKRFVFVSSIKVLGESTPDRPFKADDPFAPEDPYGVSKMEAEQLLTVLSQQSSLEVTIIRPPLVYGPGVRANFLKLLSVVTRDFPLPFKLIKNQRSLIFVDNLVDILACCLTHEKAANEAFLVSDGQDLSTADLVRAIAKAAGRRPMLLPVPPAFIKLAGSLLGKRPEVERLLGSLAVDISKDWKLLGWTPPVSVEDGLRETMQWFLSENL